MSEYIQKHYDWFLYNRITLTVGIIGNEDLFSM